MFSVYVEKCTSENGWYNEAVGQTIDNCMEHPENPNLLFVAGFEESGALNLFFFDRKDVKIIKPQEHGLFPSKKLHVN